MEMKDMTAEQQYQLENIFNQWGREDRYIDYTNETFEGGGSWEGGVEHIPFKALAQAINYLTSIGVEFR